MNRPARFLTMLLAAILIAGCAAKSKIDQFSGFADAGQQYAGAMQALIEVAGQSMVNANSQKLLQSKSGILGEPVPKPEFNKNDQAMRDNLAALDKISLQLTLLAAYFDALDKMAKSDVPEQFAQQLDGLADNLNGLTASLNQAPLLHSADGSQGVIGGVGDLAMRGVQYRKLRRNLRNSKDTIAAVLAQQERLLAAIREQLLADARFAQAREYERTVLNPYYDDDSLQSSGEQQQWMQERYRLLAEPQLGQAFQDAAAAAGKLQQAWRKLLADGMTPQDVVDLNSRLQPIVSGMEAIKASPEPPRE